MPLEREEETALFIRFRAGDAKSGDAIILGNMAFAQREADRYARSRNQSSEDLVQEAVEAMLCARATFDIGRGVRFVTYAAPVIVQRLDRYCQSQRNDWDTAYAFDPPVTECDPSVDIDLATVARIARAAAFTRGERVIVERRLLSDEPLSAHRTAKRLSISERSLFRMESVIVRRIKAQF